MVPPNIQELAGRVVSMAEVIGRETHILSSPPPPPSEWRILTAGAVAGLVVDTSLFPIDSIKSRLQSKAGFIKSGGFSNLYRGLPPVLAGSIPNAALFFITYESTKDKLHKYKHFGPGGKLHALNHVIAGSLGEFASCMVRVPYEIVKLRSQTTTAGEKPLGNMNITRKIIAREGWAGLYRGFWSTVIRDVPFSALQYPIWERLKLMHQRKYHKPPTAMQSAWYGSIAGGVAAFLTTPLDVAKTRIMLAEPTDPLASGSLNAAIKTVYAEKGVKGLFAGVVPRVIWISIGAAIFLGSYEKTIKLLS